MLLQTPFLLSLACVPVSFLSISTFSDTSVLSNENVCAKQAEIQQKTIKSANNTNSLTLKFE